MESLQAINKILRKPFGTTQHVNDLKRHLTEFTNVYEDATSLISSTFQSATELDDLKPLLACLEESMPPDLDIQTTKLLKILLRKTVNRVSLGQQGICTIVLVLRRHSSNRFILPVDICHVVLNACYDSANAQVFIDEGGLEPLLMLLNYNDSTVLSALLSAIQTISYIPGGRRVLVLNREALSRISLCLASPEASVRSRAVGVVHNLSVDMSSLLLLRENIALEQLVALLRDQDEDTLTSTSGTLQNLSREYQSKQIILESGAVMLLADLLSCSSVPCQVAAVGALFNLVGDSLSPSQKEELKQVMIDGVVLGAIRSAIFDSSGMSAEIEPRDEAI